MTEVLDLALGGMGGGPGGKLFNMNASSSVVLVDVFGSSIKLYLVEDSLNFLGE